MPEVPFAQIAQLVAAADRTAATRKTDLLELAKHCQVKLEQDFLLQSVAGRLEGAVIKVFGRLAPILILTEPCRRQVYFAVLAKLEADGKLKQHLTDERRKSLVVQLLLARSDALIAEVYGACPPGFLRLIGRLGDRAHLARYYLELFDLLNGHPELVRALFAVTKGEPLDHDLLRLILEMPRTAIGVRVAVMFTVPDVYHTFMNTYRVVAGADRLSEEHMARIANGERPSRLLESLYLDIPFSAPAVVAPEIRYACNGRALERLARVHKNCLAQFVAEALRDEHQYYLWEQEGKPAVVFSISRDTPFGWYVSGIRLAQNGSVPLDRKRELHELLEARGVRTNGSVESLMSPYRRGVPDELDIEELDIEPVRNPRALARLEHADDIA